MSQSAVDQIRAAHAQLIGEGLSRLQFTRQSRQRQGGGFSAWAAAGSWWSDCRVAYQGNRPNQVGGDAGLQQRDSTYVLSMPEDAPMLQMDMDESMARIETTHPTYGRFRLRNIKPMVAFGRTVGWQADLELIK